MASESEPTVVGFRVRGAVQQVGYRWFTRHTACALRLRGHVRNCNDGSVEVIVVGTAAGIARLEEALLRGPPGARVSEVERFAPPEAPPPGPFEIVR